MPPATRAAPARCRRSSRHAPLACEPQRLRQAQHHVHVLDRLPGRALHEIVDRGDHRESGTAHVPDGGDAERHAIPVYDVLQRRQRAVQHPHAWLVRVDRLVDPFRRGLVEHARERYVDGLENPALHRQEMRREHQVAREPALPRERGPRSEEHTSELQSLAYLVCRLLLEKKKKKLYNRYIVKNTICNNKTETQTV